MHIPSGMRIGIQKQKDNKNLKQEDILIEKKVFDRLVEKELKKFKNYVLDDDEFMIEFLSNMSIDFDNYITHDTVFGDYFGMHFYPFWHNPNQEDFTGIIDSYMLEYMVCTMYTHDPEKKFRYMLVGASSLFLGILMFGEKERGISCSIP